MKKQSENEGTRALVQIVGTPAFATGAPLTFPAATDCCNVATLDHRPRGYQALVGGKQEVEKPRSQEFKKTSDFLTADFRPRSRPVFQRRPHPQQNVFLPRPTDDLQSDR